MPAFKTELAKGAGWDPGKGFEKRVSDGGVLKLELQPSLTLPQWGAFAGVEFAERWITRLAARELAVCNHMPLLWSLGFFRCDGL